MRHLEQVRVVPLERTQPLLREDLRSVALYLHDDDVTGVRPNMGKPEFQRARSSRRRTLWEPQSLREEKAVEHTHSDHDLFGLAYIACTAQSHVQNFRIASLHLA